MLPVAPAHRWVPESVPGGPPLNVAQMWSRFATAVRAGEDVEPDFAHAVERHRLLDAIPARLRHRRAPDGLIARGS